MTDAVLQSLAVDELTTGSALAALGTGLALGAFFFWALWWTSRRALFTAAPGLFLTASFLVRMAVLLGGIWFVTGGRLLETFLSVVGILISRQGVMAAVQRSGSADAIGLAPGGGGLEEGVGDGATAGGTGGQNIRSDIGFGIGSDIGQGAGGGSRPGARPRPNDDRTNGGDGGGS